MENGKNTILLPHESSKAFAAVREGYHKAFEPKNQAEAELVDQMVAASWRIRRLIALETVAINYTIELQRGGLAGPYSNLLRTHFAYEERIADGGMPLVYARLQSAQARHFERALRSLRSLRRL